MIHHYGNTRSLAQPVSATARTYSCVYVFKCIKYAYSRFALFGIRTPPNTEIVLKMCSTLIHQSRLTVTAQLRHTSCCINCASNNFLQVGMLRAVNEYRLNFWLENKNAILERLRRQVFAVGRICSVHTFIIIRAMTQCDKSYFSHITMQYKPTKISEPFST